MTHTRLGCSTISFRHLPLPQALATIAELGFAEIDLGALPGVCDHVPYVLDATAVADVAATVAAHGVELWVESLHFHRLCFNIERAQQLTSRLEQADHHVGVVMDFSHIVASGGDPVEFGGRFGPRIAHVHLRDAVPGNINL